MKLFISYAHVDKPQVNDLVEILREAGYDPWFDHKLMPGQDWQAELLKAITVCEAFVYALTPESAASEWCQWEFAEAVKLGKPIVPVLMQAKTTLPKAISRYQYADFSDGATAKAVARLMGGLRLLMVVVPTQDAPPAPIRPTGTPAQAVQAAPRHLKVTDILPAPFAWCEIPAGKVTLVEGGWVPKGGKTEDVPAFAIAKYPVTNAQFAKFVEAGGYKQQQWWTPDGWQTREKEKWTQPRYWTDNQWNGADYPVVGVSWYEAVAFCQWLSAQINPTPAQIPTSNPSPSHRDASQSQWGGAQGRGLIALPTEQQWQRAAQGDDGRKYPWGNSFDAAKCNTSESGIGQTTPVTQYPQGASPYGVLDMAGNVWEWCVTDFNSGAQDISNGNTARVLRGGSWNFDQFNARAVSRFGSSPHNRASYSGFRVVAAVPITEL